jgi:hypothetical protein
MMMTKFEAEAKAARLKIPCVMVSLLRSYRRHYQFEKKDRQSHNADAAICPDAR